MDNQNDGVVEDKAPDLTGAAPESLNLSDSDVADARADGAKEAVKEAAKDSYKSLTDGSLPGEPPSRLWHGSDEIQLWAPILELAESEFQKRVSLKADKDGSIPDEKVYGLLALERNGQNRTPYVRAMMKRLDLKKDELPGGGPSYTNDITNISEL